MKPIKTKFKQTEINMIKPRKSSEKDYYESIKRKFEEFFKEKGELILKLPQIEPSVIN